MFSSKGSLVLFAIIGVFYGLGIFWFLEFLETSTLFQSYGISNRDYVTGLLWSCMLGGVILFLPVAMWLRKHLLALWIFRSFITLGVMIFYEDYYGKLDAFTYFKSAMYHTYEAKFE